MKSLKKIFLGMLLIALAASCGGKKANSPIKAEKAKNGVYADKVIYSVFMDESVGLKDVVEGRLDMVYTGTPSVLINGLSDTDREKIDIYSVPSGSLALWLNPIPNKAPYTVTTTAGEEVFNPLAIREVRYALNFLVNRKQIVDEVLLGYGSPMFTLINPDVPGSYKYNLLPAKLGMTDTGDFPKAQAMISEAMQKASELPENKGKLVKNGKFWEYNGKPALIKFYIRVDDPTQRLVIGREIADQLEVCGLKVERLEWDRSRSGKAVYGGNPQDYTCTMYTEGWGSGGTAAYHDVNLSQMGAPYYGYMPGGGNSEYWNYKNDEIDKLGMMGIYGQFLTADDYWKSNLRMNELIMHDSIRIWLASQSQLFITNKTRVADRVMYGAGDGFNMFSVRTANIPADSNGEKVLRVGQFSAMGKLFMCAWNPIGTGGFTDTFSSNIIGALSDPATENSPATGIPMALYVEFDADSLKSAPKVIEKIGEDGESEPAMSGTLPVNPEAEIYDSATKTWKKVGSGVTSAVETRSRLVKGFYWHNGEPMSLADVRFADAFWVEWCTKDGADDPYYDEPLETQMRSSIDNNKGTLYKSDDGYVHTFSNYFFAPDNRETAGGTAISAKAANPGRRTIFPWEIYEACSEIAAHGGASGTKWNIVEADENEIDVVQARCVADISAKLQEFIDTKHIPASLQGYITENDAIKRYKASIDFINKHGHAFISNGPCILDKIDTVANSMTMVPFDKYPIKANEFIERYATTMTAIDYIKVPTNATAGNDAVFEITVSQCAFPRVDSEPSTAAKVTLNLQLPDGSEKVYEAAHTENGVYTVTVPAADTANLPAGAYTVVALSSYADESPSVSSATLLLK